MVHLGTRRGISTFIAVLLMMVLAVSAGVVIYAYTMGYLGGLSSGETPGALSVDTSSGSTSQITIWVRNIGSRSVTMDKAYVGGQPYSMGTGNTTTAIAQGAVKKIIISGTFLPGVTYQVKLVANDNTQLSFSVKIA